MSNEAKDLIFNFPNSIEPNHLRFLRLAAMLSTVMLRTLELSAFFLQFIEWWQNEANMGDLSKLPIPDAPPADFNSEKYKGVCPLCLQRWLIPTAVSISG